MLEKFTKDMLESGKHVVEYRDGERRLYLNGSFMGMDSGALLTSYNDDLTVTRYMFLDIVKVFSVDRKHLSMTDVLANPGPLVWEREGQRVVSKEEALEKLTELYGEEVSVEW